MKHKNGVSNVVWLSLSCENLQYTLLISSFSLLTMKIIKNFIKEIKHFVRASIVCWKPWQSLWEFSSRWNVSRVFTDLLLNSPKHSPRFSPGYEGMENMFYFLSKLQYFVFEYQYFTFLKLSVRLLFKIDFYDLSSSFFFTLIDYFHLKFSN